VTLTSNIFSDYLVVALNSDCANLINFLRSITQLTRIVLGGEIFKTLSFRLDNGPQVMFLFLMKKVKYAYQELQHSEDTASPHSQEEEKEIEREHI
jgi:hypothetical protein